MKALFNELMRRNVLRGAVLYVVLSWLILQVADVLFGFQEVPTWAGRLLVSILLLGFPLVLIFAWAFEITPEGIKRESEVDRSQSITPYTARKMNMLTGILGGLAILLIMAQGFIPGLKPSARGAATNRGNVAAASIAVLPFANISSDAEQEYFSDGLSEELLNLLAKIPELTVISRTSSFQFKGKNEDVREIGRMLGVAHVLEGSVRKSANTVRITAQLINAADGSHLWSQTYDRDLNDIFAVQDEIAGAVVDALHLTILGAVPRTRAPPKNTEAYNLLLQARHFSSRNTRTDLDRAAGYVDQALAIEPGYAEAWAFLSRVIAFQANSGALPIKAGITRAREAAQRAITLDPNLVDGYIALARIEAHDRDWAAAEAHLKQAAALDPASIQVLSAKAALDLYFGRFADVIAELRRLTIRDPLRAGTHFNLGRALLALDSLAEAKAALRKGVEISPESAGMHLMLTVAYLQDDQPDEALQEAQLERDEAFGHEAMALAYHALGRKADSDAALRQLEACCAASMAYQVAQVYAYRGEVDQAFKWLDRAYEQRDAGLTEMKGDRLIENIQGDPRYRALLRKLKLPE